MSTGYITLLLQAANQSDAAASDDDNITASGGGEWLSIIHQQSNFAGRLQFISIISHQEAEDHHIIH